MDLELIISGAIIAVVPKLPIIINVFFNQTIDDSGNAVVTYTAINTIAQVQLENKQNLRHIQGINMTSIYKRFYVQSHTLTGLNRNISTGGDYIILQNLYYKIIEVVENFQTGWIRITGCESTFEDL